MNRIIRISCALALACCLNGCHTAAEVAPDWTGVYTGTMPCADCPGIQVLIELKADKTYTLQTIYIDKSDEVFTESGKFKWNARNNTITLDADLLKRCLVAGHALTVLTDGEKETGTPSGHYVFRKADPELAGRRWALTELNGNPVGTGTGAGVPYMTLELYSHRFGGDAGCNRMTGAYQTLEPGRIAFSQVVATRMMCMEMELENQFLKIFDLIERYSIAGDTLTLSGAEGIPLARFAAVPDNE